MKKIQFMQDNFLGMSYYDQIQVIEDLKKSSKSCAPKRISREFNIIFDAYLEKLKLLLEFKEVYPNFNSDKRRLTRKILLEELKEFALEHHISFLDEREKEHFCYSGEYYGESKKYFDAKPITPEEVQEFLTEFSNLSTAKKREFIEDMIFLYSRINYLKLPYPYNMLEEYKPIIQELIGEELMEYYNKLYPNEQMELILSLVYEFKWFKIDENYYNYKLKTIKENPKIIRLLKKETIDSFRCYSTYRD